MNREIKFRAWSKDENKMLEPETLRFLVNLRPRSDEFSGKEWMQFTGLKDKNGKEIYEGDLLRDSRGQVGQALWHRNSYIVEWQTRNNFDGHRDTERMLDDCFGYGEVIGNIYENQELLKA
jgi:hypothetical protein